MTDDTYPKRGELSEIMCQKRDELAVFSSMDADEAGFFCKGWDAAAEAYEAREAVLVAALNWIGAMRVAPRESWPTLEVCASVANEALAKAGHSE